VRWPAFLFLLVLARGTAAQGLPSFAELEAAGAIIGNITVETHNIFDPADPRENRALHRAANFLHIKTQPYVIRNQLLFASGELVSRRLIEETERLILERSSVYDVSIRPAAYRNGVVDIEVHTRDTWTLQPSFGLSRAGGANSGSRGVKDDNLLGTGTSLALERSSDVDRNGTLLEVSNDHLIDGWTSAKLERARYSDGSRNAFKLAHPFYALDTRWAAGFSASKFERIESIYSAGEVASQFRQRGRDGEVFGGWSPGRQGAWTRRFSGGLNYRSSDFEIDPSRPPPTELPADRVLAGPFARFELIEDDFMQVRNRDRIGRTEYLQMGTNASVQIGRSMAAFGATDQPWSYAASIGSGWRVPGGRELIASAGVSGEQGSIEGDSRSLSTGARYYVPRGSRLTYATISLAAVTTPNAAGELLLGGDSGLRGFPLRYQRGTRRALLTLEERFYTEWYPFRLFRVGGAAFFDVGRAWGASEPNPKPGWLSNAGVGLRILNARTSTGNVVHIDFAFPFQRGENIKAAQFLITTHKTF
jgi:hypothetical protein